MSLLDRVIGIKGYALAVGVTILIATPLGWAGGLHWNETKLLSWQKAAAEQRSGDLEATLRFERAEGGKVAELGMKAAERQVAIQTVTNEHIREVPAHVTPQADARCTVPVGAVRLHDAAARGVPVEAIPAAAGQSDDAASGVALSGLLSAVVANYGTCQQVRQTLTDLQAYERQRLAAAPPSP